MTADELRAFEADIARRFDAGEVKGPIHLSSGNEEQLIGIFERYVSPGDWVFGTWRAHYHALLHGVPPELLRSEILAGRSLNLKFPAYRFFTSALVGGCLPIAVGVAAGIKRIGGADRVFCFCGDMAATTGAFYDAMHYAEGHDLPILVVIEDNGYSVTTPTMEPWGRAIVERYGRFVTGYRYRNTWPHWGTKHGRSF